MKRLVDFEMYFGRSGSLCGRRVYDERDWKTLQWLVETGTEVYFGEVLGKHSDVCASIEEKDFSVVTEDQEFLETAKRLGISLSNGICPVGTFVDRMMEFAPYVEEGEGDGEDDETVRAVGYLAALKEFGANWEDD